MFCTNFGARLQDGSRFCTSCGALVLEPVPEAACESETAPEPEAAAVPDAESLPHAGTTVPPGEVTAASHTPCL